MNAMKNICYPMLRDFNPPYLGRGLVVLWFILDHDLDCRIDIKNGLLDIYYSSIPWGDGLIAFGIERDIDKDDNLKHTWVLRNFSSGVHINLKQYGYEAPDGIPFDNPKIMTDPSYWFRKSAFFRTTRIFPGVIDGTVYKNNMPTFKYLYNNVRGRNVLGCYNYDIGIRSLEPEGKLRLVGAHHGCDYTCWGGFGIVINFDIARYKREKELGIVYYTIPNIVPANNKDYKPSVKEAIC